MEEVFNIVLFVPIGWLWALQTNQKFDESAMKLRCTKSHGMDILWYKTEQNTQQNSTLYKDTVL